jgi:hypothetical protein
LKEILRDFIQQSPKKNQRKPLELVLEGAAEFGPRRCHVSRPAIYHDKPHPMSQALGFV